MKTLSTLAAMLLVASSLLYSQNGTRLVDFNAKSLGRGGTSIGVFDSPSLMMTNPAGISFLRSSTLDADLSLMFPTVHFENKINNADGVKNTFPLPSLAYVNKYENSKWSWGVGVFTAGGMGADFNLKHALYRDQTGAYMPQEYHSQLASMQGGVSVAYQASQDLSFGASLHMVYSMLEFGMPYSLDPMIMKGSAQPGMTFGQMFAAPSAMGGFGYDEVTATAKMSGLTATGFNGKLGAAYKVNEKLTVGLSYTMPASLTYKGGTATMDMTQQLNDAFGKAVQGYMYQNPTQSAQQAQAAVMGQFGQMGIDLSKGVRAEYDLNAELAFPQSIGVGVAYKPAPGVTLALDAEYLSWESAFDKMSMKMTNGSNANINRMLGSTGSFDIDFPLNWKNSVIVKLGGELEAMQDLTVRLGYAYGSNPVPQSTVFPIFPAIVESHITAGASYRVMAPLTVHAAFEMALNNSLAASVPSLIANEYDGSTSELSTTLVHLSVSYAF